MLLILDFPPFCGLCIRAVATGWLLAHNWLQPESFSITRGGGKGGVGVDNDGVNYSVVFSQTADNWTCNHNCSGVFSTLSRFGLSLRYEVDGALSASFCLRAEVEKREVKCESWSYWSHVAKYSNIKTKKTGYWSYLQWGHLYSRLHQNLVT